MRALILAAALSVASGGAMAQGVIICPGNMDRPAPICGEYLNTGNFGDPADSGITVARDVMAVPPRRYTLDEIDRMREAVLIRLTKGKVSIKVGANAFADNRTPDEYAEAENIIRTYMAAGIGTDELEARAKEGK